MQLEPRHITALDKAEKLMFHSDFCPYLDLKAMLRDTAPETRKRFRALFMMFYAFNAGGLTDKFKERFFEILHGSNVLLNKKPDFLGIFKQLSGFKRRNGDFAIPFSFVSKLVAIHYEASPIYDRHILAFFGQKPSSASIERATRIELYLDFLEYVARSYSAWARDPVIADILDRFKTRDRQLRDCHVVRLMDFLVWKVGRQQLLAQ